MTKRQEDEDESRTVAGFAAVLAAVLIAGLMVAFTAGSPAGAGTQRTIWVSTYNYFNNSPPGYGIEYARSYGYPTIHDWACCRGGGSWADPVTFAAPRSWLRPGERIYIPRLRKYFILEDLCSSCTIGPQADLWVGGVGPAQNADQDPHDIVNLFAKWPVIVDPGPGLPVDATWLKYVRI